MGMTDRQFDAFIAGLVRELEDVEKEILTKYQGKSHKLERIRKDLEDQLKRP